MKRNNGTEDKKKNEKKEKKIKPKFQCVKNVRRLTLIYINNDIHCLEYSSN